MSTVTNNPDQAPTWLQAADYTAISTVPILGTLKVITDCFKSTERSCMPSADCSKQIASCQKLLAGSAGVNLSVMGAVALAVLFAFKFSLGSLGMVTTIVAISSLFIAGVALIYSGCRSRQDKEPEDSVVQRPGVYIHDPDPEKTNKERQIVFIKNQLHQKCNVPTDRLAEIDDKIRLYFSLYGANALTELEKYFESVSPTQSTAQTQQEITA